MSNATCSSQASQPEELCLVCNDISTGYHYGVPSCNGCKTFFRRTIMKKQTFVCQYESKCPVDKSIRCACRHCRFEKCLKVGMDRNAIQQNRDPIGYTKRTRRYPLIKKAAASEEQSPEDAPSPDPVEQAEDISLTQLTSLESQCGQLRASDFQFENNLIDAVLSPCRLTDSEFMTRHAKPVHEPTVLRPVSQKDYTYWHERDWIIMIEWAKTLPAYQQLPLADRIALLRHSAMTYPSLVCCFYSPDRGADTVVYPCGAYFDKSPEPSRPGGFIRRKHQMLDQLLAPIRKLKIDLTEFAAFKAIFFLNPDADEMSSTSKALLSESRSSITNALYRYMVRTKGTDEAGDRFGRLLLLGTVLATMAVEMRETVVVADFFDQIRFSPFAKQLLFGIKQEQT